MPSPSMWWSIVPSESQVMSNNTARRAIGSIQTGNGTKQGKVGFMPQASGKDWKSEKLTYSLSAKRSCKFVNDGSLRPLFFIIQFADFMTDLYFQFLRLCTLRQTQYSYFFLIMHSSSSNSLRVSSSFRYVFSSSCKISVQFSYILCKTRLLWSMVHPCCRL